MKEWLSKFWRKLDYWEYYDGDTNSEGFLKGCCFGLLFIITIALVMLIVAAILHVPIYLF